MPRTLTAMYAEKSAAESIRQELIRAGVPAYDIDVQDQSAYSSASPSTQQRGGMMSELKNFFGGHDDHHAYAEGLQRGHILLTATVPDTLTDQAIAILEQSDAVDLQRTEAEWRQSGWNGGAVAGSRDEVIQVAEEHLVVGKREIDRGGVRVRSYIVETPVSEHVSLREENVSVERRPVNRPVAAGEDAFRERTIEMRESAEQAVVGKQTVVTEEIGIHKEVGQRTEEVRDTVRQTKVDVDRLEDEATTPVDRRL